MIFIDMNFNEFKSSFQLLDTSYVVYSFGILKSKQSMLNVLHPSSKYYY